MINVLLCGAAAGLGGFFLTWLLRILLGDLGRGVWPGFHRIRDCKPICCNVCMSFWGALPIVGLMYGAGDLTAVHAIYSQLLAAGVALLALWGKH